jgi:SAM-dependent methyltransferase
MKKEIYTTDFFSQHQQQSLESAKQIIPEILKYIQPDSVIDIGCGTGAWLLVWKQNNIKNVLGVDGDYVKVEQLMIEESEFVPHDLTKEYKSDNKYDLVCSLEVGEHISNPSAEIFVKTLCNLGNVILFSAAIPGQPGTYHINEQYPSYWASLFKKNNFIAIDCIRFAIWENENIEWWYRQNILFFVNENVISKYPLLNDAYKKTAGNVLSLVHPKLFAEKVKEAEHYKKLLRNPVSAVIYFTKKIAGKYRSVERSQ